jgi:ATP-dependent RNA helicase DeaD
MTTFSDLGLQETTLQALEKKGFLHPTPIQALTIPIFLQTDKDIIGKAQTGTGKTAAFALPLLEQLDENSKHVQALILAPTRELALQVAEEIMSLKGTRRIFVQAVYGGQSYDTQIRGLRKGAQIVVGTPGRVRDHIEKGTLQLSHVTHMVLDEADEMLNMGFLDEVEDILKSIPESKRMLLFSATMPPEILKLTRKFMRDYELVEVKSVQLTTDLIDQMFFEVRHADRFEALCRIIDTEPEFYGIVFCRTKIETDEVANKLVDRGFDAEAIHGDVTQFQRELILKKFKYKKVNILVATDVAARGIDISDLTHVINFTLPQDPEAYVHRIGRTGRAGKHGTAISIISPAEHKDLLFIQKIAKSKIRKEEVPSVADVVETKAMKVKTELSNIITNNKSAAYLELAAELLQEGSPEQVLAAVLTHTLKDTLDPAHYQEIAEVSARRSTLGANMARLFVAKGHRDGMNIEKLSGWLAEEAGIQASAIHDVRVFDEFSFVTVPFEEGEQILTVFHRKSKGKPIVTRAREEKQGGGGFREGGKSFREGGKFRDKGPRGDRPGGFRKDRPFREGEGGGFRKDKPFREGEGGGWKKDKPFREGESSGFRKDKPSREGDGGGWKKDKPFREGGERSNFNSDKAAPKSHRKGAAPTEGAPKKRSNKLTDYLDKPAASADKPAKKKPGGKSDFIPFNDDLSW